MRRIFTLGVASMVILALGACSTSKLAQNNTNDDVYYTEAKAKEQPEYSKPAYSEKEQDYRTDEQLYGGEQYADDYTSDDYYYDSDYATRLNRFYYNTPWRSYYDNYYNYSYRYDPWLDYGFNSWYRPGISFSLSFGPRYWNDYYYYSYGYPYYNRYWGPVSYYSYYPGYGYGGYYNPYYGYGRGTIYNSPNYRSRPNRQTTGYGNSGYYPNRGNAGIISSGRPERATPNSNGRINDRTSSTQPAGNGTSNRPSRPTRTQETRAPRESSAPREQQRRPEYSRPERTEVSRPAPSYQPSNSGSGGGGRSSSGSSGGGRPSRGGR
ncbi:hypothetical protein [Rubrolithibacter danxiaensis]|uniref:hypothetical protein n=1 Tax=Rubrolithibacter danxiaensis TaxID=3390805 RepID=UPI003BF7C593